MSVHMAFGFNMKCLCQQVENMSVHMAFGFNMKCLCQQVENAGFHILHSTPPPLTPFVLDIVPFCHSVSLQSTFLTWYLYVILRTFTSKKLNEMQQAQVVNLHI